ncbi:Oidioi.mRNA.OKI2018_I69.chr2.g7993.t1.cds [Oikopleura dioica]|uniref:Oidioi.mRNA.OKI2018_I69.chr2.g7993.t1.cds n=1 Tax=Oikopleura dioica TaxID=34765 RepID=A0ABN7T7V6_OIKDI|nr:Oidioi.mRNA.OKI2018_I69.chr2.g7993.t1.cds [Oikopleura dioica]
MNDILATVWSRIAPLPEDKKVRLFERIKNSAIELPVDEKLKLLPSVQNPKHLNSEQYLIPASYEEWEKNRTFLSASVKIFGAGFFVTALATSVFKRYIQKSLNYSQQVKFKGGFNTTLFSATMICSWPIIFTQAGVVNYLVNREFVDASFPSFVMRELGKDNFWNFEITKKDQEDYFKEHPEELDDRILKLFENDGKIYHIHDFVGKDMKSLEFIVKSPLLCELISNHTEEFILAKK